MTLPDLDAVLCACGECACDPATWECESARDPHAVAAARAACARLGLPLDDRRPGFLFPTTDPEAQTRFPF